MGANNKDLETYENSKEEKKGDKKYADKNAKQELTVFEE